VADRVRIASDRLTADIALHGAELQSLTDGQGRQLMSDGDPAYWTGRAPLLFPIIGRLQDDVLRLGDARFTMAKHGFARRSDFRLVEAGDDQVTLRLSESAETLASYPFAFDLDASFHLDGASLTMTMTVRNRGAEPMPFSFGYHPAFAWPLPFGGERCAHRIVFEQEEPASLARVTPYGTIGADRVASPVVDRELALRDDVFRDDALVWTDLKSRALHFGAPGHAGLDIAFPDTDMLGIWTKPGAAYVCVEPWAGIADPEDYAGDFRDKPGVIMLDPGGERSFRMVVTLSAG
jgi:galactose mutarotase-like enzyme